MPPTTTRAVPRGYPKAADHPLDVGSYPESVSPYGALDMGGNASEWTETTVQTTPVRRRDAIAGRELRSQRGVVASGGGRCHGGEGAAGPSTILVSAWPLCPMLKFPSPAASRWSLREGYACWPTLGEGGKPDNPSAYSYARPLVCPETRFSPTCRVCGSAIIRAVGGTAPS